MNNKILYDYRLKTTQQIDLVINLENYFQNRFGSSIVFNQLKQVFIKIDKLRKTLAYDQVNLTIMTNETVSKQMEEQILYYIKLVDLVYKKFENPQQPLPISTSWTDSFNPKNITQINSIKFELACNYYNLAITQYYQSYFKFQGQDYKTSLTKLRNALWTIDQIKLLLGNIDKDIIEKNGDFQHLEALYQSFNGFAYKILYKSMQQNEKAVGLNNIGLVLHQSANHFLSSYQITKSLQKSIPPMILKELIQINHYNYVSSEVIACQKLANFNESQAQDNPKQNMMGIAIGFLDKANLIMKEFLNEYSKNQEILNLQKSYIQYYSNLQQKNEMIYKQNPVSVNGLPFGQFPQQLSVTSKEPIEFKQEIQETKLLELNKEEIKSTYVQQFKELLKLYVFERQDQLRNIIENKIQQYEQNCVQAYLSIQEKQVSQAQMTPELQEKLLYVRNHGCLDGVKSSLQQLRELAKQCGALSINIRNKLNQERDQDQQLRQKYGGQWQRTLSDALTSGFRQFLQDSLNSLQTAQQIDSSIIQEFQNNEKYFQICSQSDETILGMIPVELDKEAVFFQAYKEQIQQLKELDQEIEFIQNQLFQIIDNLNSQLESAEIDQQINQYLNSDVDLQKAFEQSKIQMEPTNQEYITQVNCY